MKLMKKGLLHHIDKSESHSEDPAALAIWKFNDLKAFAIISMSISPSLQVMIRGACTTSQLWEILKNFYLRNSIHNRVRNRRRLHEFRMEKSQNIMEHFMKFDELCLSMQACGDVISMDEQLIILLGSLSDEYDPIIKIIENVQGVDLFQAKEMLHREYALLVKKETGEIALKAKAMKKSERFDARKSFQKSYKFEGKCYHCNKSGHKKTDCWKNVQHKKQYNEQAFTVCEDMAEGWLLDSQASSHM